VGLVSWVDCGSSFGIYAAPAGRRSVGIVRPSRTTTSRVAGETRIADMDGASRVFQLKCCWAEKVILGDVIWLKIATERLTADC